MKHALFVAFPSSEGISGVSEFVSSFQSNEEYPESNKMLLPGVWELDLRTGLQDLAMLVAHAKAHGLKSQVLFSESEFSWVITPSSKI